MYVNDDTVIRLGHYIIVQRQNYRKVHHFSSESQLLVLGKDKIELNEILNKQYYSTFKMIPKVSKKNKALLTLEYVPSTVLSLECDVEIKSSGSDNRNISDDGKSQKLSTEEITALRGTKSSTGIVETLITNSNTFNSKTGYSQEKYVKKKEKKYFEYIQILKPTIRILADVMYRQNPDNIMGMRIDTLSQILSYSNVQGTGTFLLYETGTSGLLPAAILNTLGHETDALLIHLHPGSQHQEKGLMMMNFTKHVREKCKSINVYSILRYFYQHYSKSETKDEQLLPEVALNITERKRTVSNGSVDGIPNKFPKIEAELNSEDADVQVECKNPMQPVKVVKSKDENCDSTDGAERNYTDNGTLNDVPTNVEKLGSELHSPNDGLHMELESAVLSEKQINSKLEKNEICDMLKNKVDCLVIATKEHPLSVFKTLVPFVQPGRPFVIYSRLIEPLQDTCRALSLRKDIAKLHLFSNWMRGYQVLPDRTHPNITMSPSSGYLLTGFVVQQSS